MKTDYAMLGKIVQKKYPDIAAEVFKLLPDYQPGSVIGQQDLEDINKMYKWFCRTYTAEANIRPMFCALVIKIYQPEMLTAPMQIRLRGNLRPAIALILKMNEANVSHIVANVIIYIRVYKDFEKNLNSLFDQFNEHKLLI